MRSRISTLPACCIMTGGLVLGCNDVLQGCPPGSDECPTHGMAQCLSATSYRWCVAGGPCPSYWAEESCPSGHVCDEDAGAWRASICIDPDASDDDSGTGVVDSGVNPG